jgi:hypothetical protein
MKRRSFLFVLLSTCWIPFSLAVVAVILQSLQITGKKTQYYALGRIVAGQISPSLPNQGDGEVGELSKTPDFYGTQMELLESGAIRVRALERMRKVHPDQTEIDVQIRVSRTNGSSILNVAAVGEEPKYTRQFLDALLDEFFSFKKDMSDKAIGQRMNIVIESVLAAEKDLKEATNALASFERAGDPILIKAEHERLVKELLALRSELEELSRKSADVPQIEALKLRIETIDKARIHNWERMIGHELLRKDLEKHQRSYDEWKERMVSLDRSAKAAPDSLMIMERPNAAVEQVPDLWSPLIIAGATGFGVGVLLMLVIASLVAAFRGPDAVSPPPLA